MRSYWGYIYDSFKAIHGWPVAAFALLFSAAAPSILPTTTIPVVYLYIPAATFFVFFAIISNLTITLFRDLRSEVYSHNETKKDKAIKDLPTVIISKIMQNGDEESLFLLIRPSPFYGNDSYVAIYFSGSDDFEILVGLGVVATIQEVGLIQVRIITWLPQQMDVFRLIANNEKDSLAKLRVKPSAPRDFVSLRSVDHMPEVDQSAMNQLRVVR